MMTLKIPFEVVQDGLARTTDLKESIDDFLRILMTSPKFSFKADDNFGFIFNNLSFENFNETEGVISNQTSDIYDLSEEAGLYDKKISGSSKNFNTFAAELRNDIQTYEPRLNKVQVSMSYVRLERQIYVDIKGTIAMTGEEYQYKSVIRVWN